MHVVHGHAVHAAAEVQQVFNDVRHTRLPVVVAGVRLVVRKEDTICRRVVPPRHSKHHHLA